MFGEQSSKRILGSSSLQLMSASSASRLASEGTIVSKKKVDPNPVVARIQQHYQQLGKEKMKISELLSEKAQYDNKLAYMQKDHNIAQKMALLKEVRQQKFLVTNRKTQFRINTTQSRKTAIEQDKKGQILKEYERKLTKGLAEGEEIYNLIVEVWTWQMRWIVVMQTLSGLDKLKHISRYRRI